MKTSDFYTIVTDRIIAELESGDVPVWLTPWKNRRGSGGIMPTNFATGHSYRGINIPLLWHEQHAKGYETACWLTYKQATDLGGHVKKGEKATTVVFTKRLLVKDKEREEEKKVGMLRTYFCFNVAQCEGLERPDQFADVRKLEPHPFIAATGADIRHMGNQPMYVPLRDFIAMPYPEQFKSEESYLATTLHELTHWTADDKRLARDLTGKFGTRKYAAEELVAELGAAFLCAHLGIEGELRHAGYVANWIELLKHDDRAIFTAASKASQAADYLRSFSEKETDDGTA